MLLPFQNEVVFNDFGKLASLNKAVDYELIFALITKSSLLIIELFCE